jgi:hypothetical protein
MKNSQRHAAALLLMLLVSLPAFAQGGSPRLETFSGGGVSFQYPATWTLSDKSSAENQHLVLELKGTAAQIMVLVERTPSTKPGERTAVLTARTNAFADIMTKELEKIGATVTRTEVSTSVGGVQADGLRLRAAPGNQPGSVEVYSFVLGGRIVMLTLLRPDTDAQAAAPAWAAVRSSLRVGASTMSAASRPPDITGTKTTSQPSVQVPSKFAGLDYGTVSGSAYTNNYFGFRLIIPYGWRVQSQEVKSMLEEKGRASIQTSDAQRNEQINASISNTVNLLTVFKYEVGSSVDFNASLICGAELLKASSISASEYMAFARKTLEASDSKYSFRPLSRETIGGEEFAVMEVQMPLSVRQKYYAAIRKNYALFFILTYATEEDEAILRQALRSVRFS